MIRRWEGRRVLIVTSSYPAHRFDYRARFVHDGAVALVREGAQCRVLTPSWGATAQREQIDGVEVLRFRYAGHRRRPVAGDRGIPENLRRDPGRVLFVPFFAQAFLRAAKRAAVAWSPDVVLGHWLLPSAVVAASANLRGLWIAHGSDTKLLARLPGRRSLTDHLRRSGVIVATSQHLSACLQRAGLGAADAVVPVGVELPPSRSLAPSSASGFRLRVAAYGRWVEGKGWPELIAAVGRVDGVRLQIAGDGPLASRLEALRLRYRDRIELRPPVVGAAAKAEFLRDCDLFAFTGQRGDREDNLPVSVVEAMAHGRPVLATRVGAMTELLSGGGGWLVEPAVDAVAAALTGLDRAECREVGARARRSAEGRGWPAVLRGWHDLAFPCRQRA